MPSPPPAASPAGDAALTEADFRIVDTEHARLFRDLLHHAGTGTGGWRRLPFRRLGNFVEARWCSPQVREAACAGGAVVNDREPGTAWRQLATLSYDSEWPACFGVVYSAGQVPAADGWGATVFYALNGRGVVGEGVSVTFLQVAGGKVVRTVDGGGWSIEVGARRFTAPVPDPTAEAHALVQSPQNFAATASMRLNALVAEVRTAREAGSLTVWEEGPYRGGGIPPARTEVPASAEVAARLAADAEAALVADRDLLVAEAATLQPLLAALLPAGIIRP